MKTFVLPKGTLYLAVGFFRARNIEKYIKKEQTLFVHMVVNFEKNNSDHMRNHALLTLKDFVL